jgi:hypothetical protein
VPRGDGLVFSTTLRWAASIIDDAQLALLALARVQPWSLLTTMCVPAVGATSDSKTPWEPPLAGSETEHLIGEPHHARARP